MGRLSFSYYDRAETGELVTRLTNDVEQVRTFISTEVVQLASSAVMLVGTSALLLWLDWRLALVTIATTVPIAIVLQRLPRQYFACGGPVPDKQEGETG